MEIHVYMKIEKVHLSQIVDSRYCSWSKQTADRVTSCPKTMVEKAEREQHKNCSSLAFIQNCTDAINFRYHCVINEFENALIEVCAPEYYIHGFCTEYNVYGAVIQPHYHLKCDTVDPPCANRYISTDAYLCKQKFIVQYRVLNYLTLSEPIFVSQGRRSTEELQRNMDRHPYLVKMIRATFYKGTYDL